MMKEPIEQLEGSIASRMLNSSEQNVMAPFHEYRMMLDHYLESLLEAPSETV